jgi:predicted RNA-binding Zn-ribbon protein involved in translation (DUF1610 family)
MGFEYMLATAILIIALLMFIFTFIIVIFSLIKWFRASAYLPSAIRVEDYACPKCGSKELEIVGGRTLRCRRCGTAFTIQMGIHEERWIIWPFFWWMPIIWLMPVRNVKE